MTLYLPEIRGQYNTGCHGGFLKVDLVLVMQVVLRKTVNRLSEFSKISLTELSRVEHFNLD